MTVRVCNLKIGDEFIMLGHQYVVLRERDGRWIYTQVKFKKGGYMNYSGVKHSMSKKSQQWVTSAFPLKIVKRHTSSLN